MAIQDAIKAGSEEIITTGRSATTGALSTAERLEQAVADTSGEVLTIGDKTAKEVIAEAKALAERSWDLLQSVVDAAIDVLPGD